MLVLSVGSVGIAAKWSIGAAAVGVGSVDFVVVAACVGAMG